MTPRFCAYCGALLGRRECARCPEPEGRPRRGAPAIHEGVFDVADELTAGDVFRWPAGAGASSWRVTAVLDEIDEVTRRVTAVPVVEVSVCGNPGPATRRAITDMAGAIVREGIC
jgi:hypothetical protein